MKTLKKRKSIAFFLLILVYTLLPGCQKDDDNNNNNNNTKDPVWIYDTGEDPYQSTPCVAGDKVIVCTLGADGDPLSEPGTHCVNKNTGEKIWKVNDTLTEMITSPLVYNDLILEGGKNPHARRLSDGEGDWIYRDDLIKLSIYSNPLLVGDAVYYACMFHIVRLGAGNGGLAWQTDGWYNNLRSSAPVFKNDRIYYADASYTNVTSFIAGTGQIEWTKSFGAAFSNKPLITDNEFYVGLQTSEMGAQTLQCLNLSDQSLKWGVPLGIIFSDLTLANGKIYVVAMQTLHCRSAYDGSEIWSYEMTAGSVAEPLVTGNKVIVGYGDGLVCLNADTGDMIWEYNVESAGFTSPTLDGDRIYVSCSNGNLYCFNID